MKILSARQVRELDAYTITHEPIASIDLMERASRLFTDWFLRQFSNIDAPIAVFCGPGNNGGDGLAIARLLHRSFYNVTVCRCAIGSDTSADFQSNWRRLPDLTRKVLNQGDPFPTLPAHTLIIDAIFGSGLNRPVTGYWAGLIEYLNGQDATIVSVDIPSGLMADAPTTSACIHANFTFSFEIPKLAFLFPENQDAVGNWTSASIGLSKSFIETAETPFHYIEKNDVMCLLHHRHKHDHKGAFGHALLVAGSYGKVGAAILAARACLRSGAGLVTVHAPRCAYEIMQMSVPEAMMSVDPHRYYLSEVPELKPYKAVGLGCGLDQRRSTVDALWQLLEQYRRPLVIDADALNILAKSPERLSLVPPNSILTPHPGEFERLFGPSANSFERNALQRQKAQELGVFIILKGAYTCIACPDGTCYFNSTGNPGMATGGSGDALTGLLTGLLAQSYSPFETALLGVFTHGLAGDLAAEKLGHEALIATDIIDHIGVAFRMLNV
jgi:hydroxyethylthiazole kinase-like uncharacterized protein yjeF